MGPDPTVNNDSKQKNIRSYRCNPAELSRAARQTGAIEKTGAILSLRCSLINLTLTDHHDDITALSLIPPTLIIMMMMSLLPH